MIKTTFYGRQSAICTQISEFLTLANSHTVLQTYRHAFSIPGTLLSSPKHLSSPKPIYFILIPGAHLSSPEHVSN